MNYEMTVLGSQLSAADQKHVLAAYVHRYTREHKPGWACYSKLDGKPYRPQFASDAEWLANTRFQVTKSGKLDARVRSCYSTPTWPEGK